MDWRTVAKLGAVAAGTAIAAGTAVGAVGVATDRRRARRRARRGEDVAFGSLHASGRRVVSDDGVGLHVEVDDGPTDAPTIVFVHGWVLDLNCWHYQRAALRGEARMVFYDQRVHGLSDDSPADDCTLEQLGRDLRAVIEAAAPEGPLILVGHSMGGMSVMSFAAQFGDVMAERVVGVVLMGTSAGNLVGRATPLGRISPLLPALLPVLGRRRRFDTFALTRRWAVGPDAEAVYADMTDEMLAAARPRAYIDFASSFLDLDLYASLAAMPHKRTVVIGGTADKLTPMRHSERLAEQIDDADLVVLEGSGHMMMLERHADVTERLTELWEDAQA
ncbi:pimeloyl-ACP methyl ester carboxylesterase [Mumia flava]|uniref:Pimeloyl-ACP methyl ester carboxylesterase n=1 Tax=Mumia flava TaxID=1348852 RepID=A0A0B2BN63_9ACTN|nr:alpha/beta hydrolase [Mumia flava]PJJ58392.1 pimeloyl-ACP methyl ester carboxylesterase [Mumia flava]